MSHTPWEPSKQIPDCGTLFGANDVVSLTKILPKIINGGGNLNFINFMRFKEQIITTTALIKSLFQTNCKINTYKF